MKRNTVNVKVEKDLAHMMSIYCRIHQIKMVDFATTALKEKLKGFEIQ